MTIDDIQNGDILMFYPSGILGKLVAFITGSQYCHCGIVEHVDDGFFLKDFLTFGGYRYMRVEEAVVKWGVNPDVFRLIDHDTVDVHAAVAAMKSLQSAKSYGWYHAIWIGLLKWTPKWMFQYECNWKYHAPHCSEAVNWSFRTGAGIDLVKDIPDWRTSPGDIARSEMLYSVGTLDCQ